MEDFELILYDRINAIRDTINKYGEDNFFISFSGGKDSTILHYLIDIALPNNNIDRVFVNTGIEYNAISNYVKEMQDEDSRIKIKDTDEVSIFFVIHLLVMAVVILGYTLHNNIKVYYM